MSKYAVSPLELSHVKHLDFLRKPLFQFLLTIFMSS